MAASEASAQQAAQPQGSSGIAGQVPDFFIVGHPKCGTTALWAMLRRHPQIHMPGKEFGFFAPEWRARRKMRFWRQRANTLEEYMSFFAGARPGQRVGEATPSYLRSSEAARRIAALRPDARIIAIFREPVDFLRSFHLQALHNYVETQKDFTKAIALEQRRREGRRIPLLSQSPPALLYSDHVRYVEQLRRFYDVFPREQVLVLIYDDLNADNEGTLRSMLRFLDVEDDYPIESQRLEPLRAIRSLHLAQLTRAASIVRSNLPGRRLFARLSRRASRPPRRGLWGRVIYKPATPLDEQFVREQRLRFKPQVEALGEYLDRDLVSLWGYDELD